MPRGSKDQGRVARTRNKANVAGTENKGEIREIVINVHAGPCQAILEVFGFILKAIESQ